MLAEILAGYGLDYSDDPSGLTALVPGGPQLHFGDGTQLAAKAQAAAAVLGALVAPATYIDVSVPGAPVAG